MATMPESPLRISGAKEYQGFSYRAAENEHAVYWRGNGPAVIILHELGGLAHPTFVLADRVVDAGFRVAIPHLFGTPMDDSTGAQFRNYARLCISAEFARLAANVTAPITVWLRCLATDLARWCEWPKVGAIGMCLTGGFVLPMIIEDSVTIAVTSQPAIPIRPRQLSNSRMRAQLNVSSEDIRKAANQAEARNKQVVGFRFSEDWICPMERFARLRDEFGTRFFPNVYDTPAPEWGLTTKAHSVLTYSAPEGPANTNHPSHRAIREVLRVLEALREPQ
jgi:dienelactone hydrolase